MADTVFTWKIAQLERETAKEALQEQLNQQHAPTKAAGVLWAG